MSTIDEPTLLKDNARFLSGELKLKEVVVSEEDTAEFDPGKKAKLAEPLRPSFYLE